MARFVLHVENFSVSVLYFGVAVVVYISSAGIYV